ncbi:MAG: PIN domain-containing protein [Sideroxydans sp.]|nr:PIN domain-containing protein [Sideroxydans sp.]
MKIYLDVCCLNRPFDDQSQMRVHLEAEAVLGIIRQVEQAEWTWVSSDAVLYEISKTPNEERKERLWSLESGASLRLELTEAIYQEAEKIQQLGFTALDALHISCARMADVDVFLSTDDKLLKKVRQHIGEIELHAVNPLAWLQEVI